MEIPELKQYTLPDVPADFITRDQISSLLQSELNQVTRPINYGSGDQIFRVSNEGLQLGSGSFSSAPFRVTMAGAVTATAITITGGTLNFGKTSFSDSVNAGYYISSSGLYFGSVGDASYLKYDIGGATLDYVGNVSGRSSLALALAINASSNLVTDVINAKLDTSTKDILSDFNFGTVDYAGAVNAGNVTWNTTTGAVTGGSGVLVYRKGIVGVNAGATTFSIDATTGAATFAGALSAPSGNIGGFTLGATTLSATNLILTSGAANVANIAVGTGSNLAGMNSANSGTDIAFWAGASYANRATAPFRVNAQGDLFATSASSSVTGAAIGAFGDGSDGAFAVSSGTTTWNTAGKVTYFYTSFSLTGTGALTFGSNLQNKEIVVYVQGNLDITSSTVPCIDGRGLGGLGGAGGVVGVSSGQGANGSPGSGALFANGGNAGGVGTGGAPAGAGGGGGGGLGNNGTNGGNGAGGATGEEGGIAGASTIYDANAIISRRIVIAHLGAGGGGGNAGQGAPAGAGAAGGNGGGCLIFIVGGNINITGTINMSGVVGANGANGAGTNGGGGGGGGGGFFGTYYYGSVTANTGTYTVSGAVGGSAGAGAGTAAGAGGTGGSGQSEVRKLMVATLLA